MSITIQINPAIEKQLREKAAKKGVGLDSYLAQALEYFAQADIPADFKPQESELLKNIDLGFSAAFWDEYKSLVQKRQSERIENEELERLIEMTRQVERANVKRMESLVTLARLRKVSLRELMQQLGIRPESYA